MVISDARNYFAYYFIMIKYANDYEDNDIADKDGDH